MMTKEQIVVIRYGDDDAVCAGDVMYVLLVKNYDHKFDHALYELGETYEENCGMVGPDNEYIEFEDFVLQQIDAAGYEYEFTGFEEYMV